MNNSDRNLLLGSSSKKSLNTNPFDDESLYPGNDGDSHLTDIRIQQKSALQEQEKGLGNLLGAVKKQKQMATDIGNELDDQDQMLDQIGTSMHNVTESVTLQNRLTQKTFRKSGTCCMHVIIVVLLVIIVIVAVIPRHK